MKIIPGRFFFALFPFMFLYAAIYYVVSKLASYKRDVRVEWKSCTKKVYQVGGCGL